MKGKTITTNALGFPIVLSDVPVRRLGGEVVLDVNWRRLQQAAFASLPGLSCRLTGNQVRFIRQYLGLTLQAFGKQFQKSHVAVRKWEMSGDDPARIDWSIEKDIRLFVQDHVSSRAKHFQALYHDLRQLPTETSAPLHFRIQADDVVAA